MKVKFIPLSRALWWIILTKILCENFSKYLVSSKIMPTFASQSGKRPPQAKEVAPQTQADCLQRTLKFAKIAQLVEHDLAKVGVAGSSPVFRSKHHFNGSLVHLVIENLLPHTTAIHFPLCENSSVGRARPCQGRGRGFESRFSLH